MHFDLSEDQGELQRATRRFLVERYPSETLRRAVEREDAFDEALWRQVSAELAWTGLAIEEDDGGYGFSWIELGVVLEECGRHLLALPIFESAGASAATLQLVAHEDARKNLLPGIASGEAIYTCAFNESSREASWLSCETRARRQGESWVLSGKKYGVSWGHAATHFLITARDDDGALRLFVAEAGTPGLEIERFATMDRTRPAAHVKLQDLRLPQAACIDDQTNIESRLERAHDVASALLACEQVGVAERSLEMSVAYAKERVQFGRPIGSFQAIKHKCADMLVQVECARSAAWYGIWAASAAGESELREAAAIAGVSASEAAWACTAEAIQIHGGIGITWEHDIHFYFKRARADEHALGSPASRREAYFRDHLATPSTPRTGA